MFHELLEARLEDELTETLHQIEAPEQDKHRSEIPSVQDSRVTEEHEDRGDARRGDDDRLHDLQQKIEAVLKLVLELGPEEKSKQTQVADHQAPTALYCRTPTRHTRWNAK